MGTLRLSVALEHTCVAQETPTGFTTGCDCHLYRKRLAVWKPPTYIGFQAPVPPPPDYSTPAKVNARCWEAAFGVPEAVKAARDKSFAKALKELRKVAAPVPCSAEDRHAPKWEYRLATPADSYRMTPDVWERRALGSKNARWVRLKAVEESDT